MPMYEYKCANCGKRFELIQKFSDAPLTVHEECGSGPVERLISAPALQFKGTGWYVTDYAKGNGPSPNNGSSAGSEAGGKSEGSQSESKSEGKSDGGSKSESSGSKESGGKESGGSKDSGSKDSSSKSAASPASGSSSSGSSSKSDK
jgi:putative FmdB family regulatory protein